jgi:hypothetical protein
MLSDFGLWPSFSPPFFSGKDMFLTWAFIVGLVGLRNYAASLMPFLPLGKLSRAVTTCRGLSKRPP